MLRTRRMAKLCQLDSTLYSVHFIWTDSSEVLGFPRDNLVSHVKALYSTFILTDTRRRSISQSWPCLHFVRYSINIWFFPISNNVPVIFQAIWLYCTGVSYFFIKHLSYYYVPWTCTNRDYLLLCEQVAVVIALLNPCFCQFETICM